jgi:hypothetical protein
MAERYAFTLRDGTRLARVTYAQRDLRFLGGPLLPEARTFVQALGLWDNFKVDSGMDTEAWTTRSAAPLLAASKTLLSRIAQDSDVLGFDYQFAFPEKGMPKGSGAASGFTVGGRHGLVQADVPGQLYMTFTPPASDGTFGEGDIQDLRRESSVPTSWGPLMVHRSTKPVVWLTKLPAAIAFLEEIHGPEVQIRHHFAKEPSDGRWTHA